MYSYTYVHIYSYMYICVLYIYIYEAVRCDMVLNQAFRARHFFVPCHKPHWEAHRRRVWAGL